MRSLPGRLKASSRGVIAASSVRLPTLHPPAQLPRRRFAALSSSSSHPLAVAPPTLLSAGFLHDPSDGTSSIVVTLSSGAELRFHTALLRDHCACAACTDPRTQQRLFDTGSLPPALKPASVVADAGTGELVVAWPAGDAGSPAHVSRYPLAWLTAHGYCEGYLGAAHPSFLDAGRDARSRVLWGAATFGGRRDPHADRPFPRVEHSDYMGSDTGLARALAAMRDYGYIMVEGVPVGATIEAGVAATDAALRRIGFLKRTLYGDGTWCVAVKPTAAADNNDTAYSCVALPAHTDGNYWAVEVAQAFHCISPDAGGGGETLLVDGFAVAERLRAHAPATFDFFSTFSIPYHHTEASTIQLDAHPVFRLRPDGGLASFHFNNDDRAPIVPLRGEGQAGARWDIVTAFYTHLRVLLAALRSAEAEVWVPLKPGTLLIFDNSRVLHGRSALSGPGCGRVLAGAYIDGDVWRGRLRALAAAGASGV